MCPQNKFKAQCRDCGGASICGRGKRKSTCRDCGGSSICPHSRQRAARAAAGRPSAVTGGRNAGVRNADGEGGADDKAAENEWGGGGGGWRLWRRPSRLLELPALRLYAAVLADRRAAAIAAARPLLPVGADGRAAACLAPRLLPAALADGGPAAMRRPPPVPSAGCRRNIPSQLRGRSARAVRRGLSPAATPAFAAAVRRPESKPGRRRSRLTRKPCHRSSQCSRMWGR